MKLYVIRHGNTDSNRLDIYNGKLLNEDINNIGIKQAQEASKKIKNLNLYDEKYKWSINLQNDEYYVRFYPKDDIQIGDIPNQLGWGSYRDFVTYSTEELKTREARETFTELYQLTADKLYGIDDIFDSIIGDDDTF